MKLTSGKSHRRRKSSKVKKQSLRSFFMHDFAEMRAYYPSDLFNIALDKIPCGGI